MTGENKELSPQLKTKDNVDLAGLSVLLVLLKVSLLSPEKDYNLSLNNNYVTVLNGGISIWDVTED